MWQMQHKNNFDIIRFFAASSVVLSHSFQLPTGKVEDDPLWVLSHQTSTIGSMAVWVFFIISGYLVISSAERSRPFAYFMARVLRIFPALMLVAFMSSFVLGPLITNDPGYWTRIQTYKYFLGNASLIQIQYTLPGVFTENAFRDIVNGALWTLKLEFYCYIIFGLLMFVFFSTRKYIISWFFVFLYVGYFFVQNEKFPVNLREGFDLFRYFAAGAVFYLWREQIPLKSILAWLALGMVALGVFTGLPRVIFPIAGTYLVLYLALGNRYANFATWGDFSYGIYLWGFPIQQLIVMQLPNSSWFINFILALSTATSLAFFSWNLIEKRALSLKKRVFIRKFTI
jgi:peptidoglycan/LPS O-acetylase OafA/YrhL